MTRNAFFFSFLSWLLTIWTAPAQQQPVLFEHPAGSQIPCSFEAAKQETCPGIIDIQGALRDTLNSSRNLSLAHGVIARPLLHGTFSYYGQNNFSGSRDFDFQIQKLFFTQTFQRIRLSAGLGYDFNRVRNTDNRAFYGITATDGFGNPVMEELHKRLAIHAYDENRYYGNVNAMVPLRKKRKLFLATDLLYSTQDGYKYFERFDENTKSNYYNESLISYYDLHSQAFSYHYYLGALLQRQRTSKKGRPFSQVWILSWDHTHQHSNPEYIRNIQPYFGSSSPELGTTTQYIGINNRQNRLLIKFSLADRHPDLVMIQRPLLWGPLHFQCVLDQLSMALSFDYNTTDETHINRWKRPKGIFWGETRHAYTDAPAAIIFDHAFRFFLFRYLYAKFEYISYKKATYNKRFIGAELDHDLYTSFGARFILKERFLCEIKHLFHRLHLGASIFADYTDFTKNLKFKQSKEQGILLRFTILP